MKIRVIRHVCRQASGSRSVRLVQGTPALMPLIWLRVGAHLDRRGQERLTGIRGGH